MIQVEANKRYEALTDTLFTDKLKQESLLEIYKAWEKLTGVNGLQSKIMIAPFLKFGSKITVYLQRFINDGNTIANFSVGEKANSFSFGIVRNGSYIEYDMLSSGEKCLYTFAMLLAIISESQSYLKLVMVDDLLDHLDNDRIIDCFATLYTNTECQIIIAGVQNPVHEDADSFVINI